MSQKTIELAELVNSLSNLEKSFFRKFHAKNTENAALLELFELYTRSKEDTFVKSKVFSKLKEKEFQLLKEQLFNSICDAMCYYHKEDLKPLSTYAHLQKIYFLISKNIYREAEKQVVILKKKLLNSPQRAMVPLLYGIETFLYLEQKKDEALFSAFQKNEEYLQPLIEFKEVMDTRHYLYATTILSKKGHLLSKKANVAGLNFIKTYQRTYDNQKKFTTPLAELNHLNGIGADLRLNIGIRLNAAIQQYELIKKNPKMFLLDVSITSLYNVICLTYHNKDYKTGHQYLHELKQIKPLTLSQKQRKAELLLECMLVFNCVHQAYPEIIALIQKFEKDSKKLHTNNRESVLAVICHFKIFANIFLANIKENKKLILRFSTSELKRNQPDLFETYRILEILNAIELNDFDVVVYLLRNAKLSFQKDKSLFELMTIIEHIKNGIELQDFSKRESILNRLEKLYAPLFMKDSSRLVFHYFDLRLWADKKLQAKR